MPSKSFRTGVPTVQIPVESSTSLPSLATLTFTASAVTPVDSSLNDVRRALDPSVTYQVSIGLLGRDSTTGGYTVGRCSPSSGDLTISAGQGIQISVQNEDWPAGVEEAFAVAVWLKSGAGNFALCQYAYMDPDADFVTAVFARPTSESMRKSITLLQSASSDDDLGDRDAKGFTFRTPTPTSGGVQISRDVSTVTFTPDTANDFQGTTTRTASISFELLQNDVKDIVDANAGTYIKHTFEGTTYEESQMSLFSASARLTGNKPLKLVMPQDGNGYQEIRLYIGQLTQNQEGNQESWTKDNQTTVSYSYSPAPLDTLVQGVNTEITYKKHA